MLSLLRNAGVVKSKIRKKEKNNCKIEDEFWMNFEPFQKKPNKRKKKTIGKLKTNFEWILNDSEKINERSFLIHLS